MPFLYVCLHVFQLMRYSCQGMGTGRPKVEMAPSCLKQTNSVLSPLTLRPVLLVDCQGLCSSDSVCVGVFARSGISSIFVIF